MQFCPAALLHLVPLCISALWHSCSSVLPQPSFCPYAPFHYVRFITSAPLPFCIYALLHFWASALVHFAPSVLSYMCTFASLHYPLLHFCPLALLPFCTSSFALLHLTSFFAPIPLCPFSDSRPWAFEAVFFGPVQKRIKPSLCY